METKEIAIVREEVRKLLGSDKSGHDASHVERVEALALKFNEEEKQDAAVVSLIALLHDADDYKLFGKQSAENLSNTRRIMNLAGIPQQTQETVIEAISTIGYSKRLKGITPALPEAKIVSDADMCDALGALGIIRSFQYASSKGNPLFDRNLRPVTKLSAEVYQAKTQDTVVNHCFEKLLKLRGMMLTEAGKKEAEVRHDFIVFFLRELFEEENAPEWADYLNQYLKGL